MPIRRLLYTSCSSLEPGERSVDEQIADIVRRSVRNNKASGVTGLLVHLDNQFIQILEGENDAVDLTFERICCDFTHTDIKLLDLVAASSRMFEGWHMARLDQPDIAEPSLADELHDIRFLLGVNARVAAEKMQECFFNRQQMELPPLV